MQDTTKEKQQTLNVLFLWDLSYDYDIAGVLEKNRPWIQQSTCSQETGYHCQLSANITEIMRESMGHPCPVTSNQIANVIPEADSQTNDKFTPVPSPLNPGHTLQRATFHQYPHSLIWDEVFGEVHVKPRPAQSIERSLGNSSQHLLRLSCLICHSSQQTALQTCTSRFTQHCF